MNSTIGPLLITGGDTGIGRFTAEKLASQGYKTYVGFYLESSIHELNSIPNIQAVKLDVTSQVDIDNLVKWIEDEGQGLYGLVNNAGISDYWPLMECDDKSFDRILQVNLYGVFKVTRALFPFLRESKGRILSMGSLSGTIPTKFIGAYTVSKFGVEALMDVIHSETKKFGITAITIKPGNIHSDITMAVIPLQKSRMKMYEKSLYKEESTQIMTNLDNSDYWLRAQYDKPDNVANSIIEALTTDNPKVKYLVTNTADTESAIGWMFRVIAQLNQNHPNAITKEKLHEMMDQQLTKFA
ncbi:MAG: SDR family NAD(P)-dependent oxidoreductase [Candidatus Heimdallarchaeota archaeon]|nr:SDR family NAD(P)-dependent oxidoreductase [Candidatus Heimdallarchaeota archaeon]